MPLTSILLLVFIGSTLHAQTIEEQIHSWNTENEYAIYITEFTTTVDWTKGTMTSKIQLSWSDENDPYLMPQRALKWVESIHPSLLSYSMKSLQAVDQQSLLQLSNSLEMSSEILTQLLHNSILKRFNPDKNIFRLNVFYFTELLPILYNSLLPQYNVRVLPRTLNIDYKTETEYDSIIFAVEDPIPLISDPEQMIEFPPKLFPKVYGSNNELIYSPEYYEQDSENVAKNQRAYTYFFIDDLQEIAPGKNPYIIIPTFINAAQNGDVVLSTMDTERILNNESLRKNIREGRVYFSLSQREYILLDSQNTNLDER